MDIISNLEALSTLPGPSGFERTVAQRAGELLRPYMDQADIDRFGNLLGMRLCGKENAKKILLDAHLDEVGLMVTGIQDGFLRFRPIGGVDPRVLPNQAVEILSNPPHYGLIAWLPPHVQTAADQDKGLGIDELWIDVGMSQEESEAAIPIGTPIVYHSRFTKLRNGYVAGKALDDRAGFLAILYAAEKLSGKELDVDLYIMGSSREEVGGGGASVGTYSIAPDCCIAVDVTFGKTLDTSQDDTFLLGKGPVIGIGPNMTPWMKDRLVIKAGELGYSWQPEVMSGPTGTNAWQMQVSRRGAATGLLSIPLRYMHSPNEMLLCSDIEQTGELLAAFIEGLGKEGRWAL